MPQFKGKIFILENYNIGIARYLVSGVDVWLNNPRRPMEASGTSGEKASANGVVNFSILDGWWAEGYDGTNGWAIGTNASYNSYEEQDKADSNSMYHILENKIIPAYYNQDKNGISKEWLTLMKNSIKTTAGEYSTSRMVVDYTTKLYMPLCELGNNSFSDLEKVIGFTDWKKTVKKNWENIQITQDRNVDNARMNAGSIITVNCEIELPEGINEENTEVQVYFGQILESGTIRNVYTKEMRKVKEDKESHKAYYEADLDLITGGNFGYTFRVLPKHEMLMDPENMDLIKWAEK
jgi:starch phosphorylase